MTFRFALVLLLAAGLFAQDRTVTLQYPVQSEWMRTGIVLNPGATVTLQASGSIEAAPPNDNRALFHRVPPEGRPVRQGNKPQPMMRALALLARIGDGPVWEAGAQAEVTADGTYGTGELQFSINDDYVADNSGTWSVRIAVRNNAFVQQSGRDDRRDPRNLNQGRGNNNNAASAIDAKEREFASFFGAPISATQVARDGTGRYREYRNGAIYWHPNTGAFEIHGGIRDKWNSMGAESGPLGYPVSDEYAGPDGQTRINRFQHGAIIYDQRNGSTRVENARQ